MKGAIYLTMTISHTDQPHSKKESLSNDKSVNMLIVDNTIRISKRKNNVTEILSANKNNNKSKTWTKVHTTRIDQTRLPKRKWLFLIKMHIHTDNNEQAYNKRKRSLSSTKIHRPVKNNGQVCLKSKRSLSVNIIRKPVNSKGQAWHNNKKSWLRKKMCGHIKCNVRQWVQKQPY
jgi:hypothetical protein